MGHRDYSKLGQACLKRARKKTPFRRRFERQRSLRFLDLPNGISVWDLKRVVFEAGVWIVLFKQRLSTVLSSLAVFITQYWLVLLAFRAGSSWKITCAVMALSAALEPIVLISLLSSWRIKSILRPRPPWH